MTFLSKVFLFGFSLYLTNLIFAIVPWSVLGSLTTPLQATSVRPVPGALLVFGG